ncbi:Putative dihydroflavonol 4-reductase [Vanrija pseudolonga]|uniref:Dihydroflavonol 4-reductase n=1 Tax=Vanrija pseudolonga TaxID=143232 RepID=A0AAF0YIN8_9TREE|nr:Putative dihydroflavonol 4-reductase [Vanrija pseudolonga]
MSTKLKIAITGCTGIIGTHVVRYALEQGHDVVAIDRAPRDKGLAAIGITDEGFKYVEADATDYDAFKAAAEGCTALIHLAAVYTLRAPDGTILREVPQHVIHNTNTAMSWNALSVAQALGIKRVAMASSVNAVGMIFSNLPQFDYIPLDEKHPLYPEDAYSVCKRESEIQCEAFARRYPGMRIASLRFHWVIPDSLAYDPVALDEKKGTERDLWGWVSTSQTARACLLSLTAPESTFPPGHEAFFIVAPTAVQRRLSSELLEEHYPEIKDIRRTFTGNEGFYDVSKAEKMLGWKEKAFLWTPGSA